MYFRTSFPQNKNKQQQQKKEKEKKTFAESTPVLRESDDDLFFFFGGGGGGQGRRIRIGRFHLSLLSLILIKDSVNSGLQPKRL